MPLGLPFKPFLSFLAKLVITKASKLSPFYSDSCEYGLEDLILRGRRKDLRINFSFISPIKMILVKNFSKKLVRRGLFEPRFTSGEFRRSHFLKIICPINLLRVCFGSFSFAQAKKMNIIFKQNHFSLNATDFFT